MAQSTSTIDGMIALTRLVNRVATPDRSSTIKEAKSKLDEAAKRLRSAQSPDRATERITIAQNTVATAEERLAKLTTIADIAKSKLIQAESNQKSIEEIQLLQDAVDVATDRLERADRKVIKLKESVRLTDLKFKQGTATTEELETEQVKLSRASIQLRARESEYKQTNEALRQAQNSVKTPEELQLLRDRLNEAQGNVDRATQKLEVARLELTNAQTDAQTIAAEYIQAESELVACEQEYDRISQATEAEVRFERIERSLSKVEQGAEIVSDIQQAAALLPKAEFWWNSACLGATALTALIYFTPLAGVLQKVTKGVQWTIDTAVATKDAIESGVSQFAPALKETPKVGETIAGWTVTSVYGPRSAPVAGASTFHGGVDLADPRGPKFTVGRELYSIGKPGTQVEVTCWEDSGGGGLVATLKPKSMPGRTIQYLHLSKCLTRNGETRTVKAGEVIARVGDSGIGSAPHAHIEEKDAQNQKVPARRGIIWWALTGEEPQPVISQSKTN